MSILDNTLYMLFCIIGVEKFVIYIYVHDLLVCVHEKLMSTSLTIGYKLYDVNKANYGIQTV